MWGYEGEELSDIEATVEHVKACRPDVFFTTVSYPIKGTPYYDEVAPKLVQLGAWESTTDRDVQIRGRHSRRFYQFADQLLRSRTPGRGRRGAAPVAKDLQRGGGMSSTALFDRLAARYDELWTNTPIGRAQRDPVWREIDPLFHPGQRILDIGCGTGEDAAHFTARGVTRPRHRRICRHDRAGAGDRGGFQRRGLPRRRTRGRSMASSMAPSPISAR